MKHAVQLYCDTSSASAAALAKAQARGWNKWTSACRSEGKDPCLENTDDAGLAGKMIPNEPDQAWLAAWKNPDAKAAGTGTKTALFEIFTTHTSEGRKSRRSGLRQCVYNRYPRNKWYVNGYANDT